MTTRRTIPAFVISPIIWSYGTPGILLSRQGGRSLIIHPNNFTGGPGENDLCSRNEPQTFLEPLAIQAGYFGLAVVVTDLNHAFTGATIPYPQTFLADSPCYGL